MFFLVFYQKTIRINIIYPPTFDSKNPERLTKAQRSPQNRDKIRANAKRVFRQTEKRVGDEGLVFSGGNKMTERMWSGRGGHQSVRTISGRLMPLLAQLWRIRATPTPIIFPTSRVEADSRYLPDTSAISRASLTRVLCHLRGSWLQAPGFHQRGLRQ